MRFSWFFSFFRLVFLHFLERQLSFSFLSSFKNFLLTPIIFKCYWLTLCEALYCIQEMIRWFVLHINESPIKNFKLRKKKFQVNTYPRHVTRIDVKTKQVWQRRIGGGVRLAVPAILFLSFWPGTFNGRVSLSSDIFTQRILSTMAEREDNVYKAKLAEQAERYDGKALPI